MEEKTAKGATIPALGFGTWPLQGETCYEAVLDALAIGYRHIDTARVYGNEDEVGRAIADSPTPRDALVLATKLWHDELDPAVVRPRVEDSLRRLRTDSIDLLLVHWPVGKAPLADTLAAMVALVDDGLVRHLGVSNCTVAHMREASAAAPVVTNQVEYHPYLSQEPLLAEAARDGHLLTAYSPTARGRILDDPTIAEIAAGHAKTPAQVVLRWLVSQPEVIALARSANPQRRRENLAIFDFALTEEETAALHSLAHPGGRGSDPPFAPAWDT